MADSFYWYDFETFGTHPGLDRPSQFAGVRTDANLQPVGEELLIYNQLTDDYLPQPEACRVTGIGPSEVNQKGLREYQFIQKIHAELTSPNTCLVGYNSIRFDDEFTRYTLFRNFYDPYEHEWKNGNSRWDLLDVVRLTRALRPNGIEWPLHPDGKPSNRLEDLTAANGIGHLNAHDALADVHATIAVARLIRDAQPKLFDYALAHRTKAAANTALNLREQNPVLHISGMLPGEYGHAAIVAPITRLTHNRNGVVVFDLRADPAELADLDAEAIRQRVFTPKIDMPEGINRLPLKTVHVNRSPVLVPLSTLDDASAERLQINKAESLKHLETLRNLPNLNDKIIEALKPQDRDTDNDVDGSLYSGGFFSDSDKRKFTTIRSLTGTQLSEHKDLFDDPRVDEMLFRYRARNWPDSLNEDESRRWTEHRKHYVNTNVDNQQRLALYNATIEGLEWPEHQQALKQDLLAWGQSMSKITA
ncbi:MAG: exodeoxyribonuclease I [Granulosicoccus sp.]|nr:exodeoxyribonuclease I [Granulosicoccus sp.]